MKNYDLFDSSVELPSLNVETYGDSGPIRVGKWLVADGDTVIDTESGESIRLRGVDTRETAKPEYGKSGERGGSDQRKALADLIRRSGGQLTVESAGSDSYGRTVGTLYDADGNDLNREMLRGGAAFEVFDGDDPYREDRIARLRDQDLRRELGERVRSEYDTPEYRNYANSRAGWQRDPDTGDVFKASVARGTDELQASLYKAAEWLGDATGSDRISEWGEEGFLRNVEEAAANPAQISRFDDIDSLSDGWTYFVETLGAQVPQLLVDAGLAATGAGMGAVAGRRAAVAGANKALNAAAMKGVLQKMGPGARDTFERRVKAMALRQGTVEGAKKGGWAAFTASTLPQHLGENYQAQQEAGVETPWGSLIPALANTALDVYGTERLLSLIIRDKKEAVAGISGILAEGARRGGIGLTTEGITEMAQSVVTEAAIKAQKDGHDIDWFDVFDAGIRGALVGGSLGGAGGVLQGTLAPTEFTPEPEQDVRAQARDLADPDSPRDTIIAHPDNADAVADELSKAGVGASRRATEDGNVVFTTREDGAGVGTDGGNADALGYTESLTDVTADPNAVVVQAQDEAGAVVKEQGATAAGAAAARERLAEEYPAATIVEMTPEDAQARRASLREREAQAFAGTPVADRPVPPTATVGTEPADSASVARNEIAPDSEVATKSVFADESGRTLRPAKEVLADLGSGRLDVTTIADAMDRAGIKRSGTALTEQVKIDRYQLARDLQTAGVYALGGKKNNAFDVATSELSDAELVDLARKNGVPVYAQRERRRGDTAAAVVRLARENDWVGDNLERVGLRRGPSAKELLSLDNATFERAVWAAGSPKEGLLDTVSTRTEESMRSRLKALYRRLNVVQESAPAAVKEDSPALAAAKAKIDRFQQEAYRRSAESRGEEYDAKATAKQIAPDLFPISEEEVAALDDLDALKVGTKPEDITQGELTDEEIRTAAKSLGIKFSNKDFNRNQLIRQLQAKVKEVLRTEQSERSVVFGSEEKDAEFSRMTEFSRRAAYDMAVLDRIAGTAGIDSAPLRGRVIDAHYQAYLNDSDFGELTDDTFGRDRFAAGVAQLLSAKGEVGSGIRGHVSRTVPATFDAAIEASGLNSPDAVYEYADRQALINMGAEGYSAVYSEQIDSPAESDDPRHVPRARVKGESDTPPATQSDEELHRERQLSALRGSTAFFLEGELFHVGSGTESSKWSADVKERAERFGNDNLIYGQVSDAHLKMFGKRSVSAAQLTGAVDAVRLTQLGREYASRTFGSVYGELYNAFLIGRDLAREAGVAGDMPVLVDDAFITDELVIGEHPVTGDAIRLSEARELAQRDQDLGNPLNQLDPIELTAKIEGLERDLLDAWESVDMDSLGGQERQALDDWFYATLNFGEQRQAEILPYDADRWTRIDGTKDAQRRAARRLARGSYDKAAELIQARMALKERGDAWVETRGIVEQDDIGFDGLGEMERIRDTQNRGISRDETGSLPVSTVGNDTLRPGQTTDVDFADQDYDRFGNLVTEDGEFNPDAALEAVEADPALSSAYEEMAAVYGEARALEWVSETLNPGMDEQAVGRALIRARLSQPIRPLQDALQAAIDNAPNEQIKQRLEKQLAQLEMDAAKARDVELQKLNLREAEASAIREGAGAARKEAATVGEERNLKTELAAQGVVTHLKNSFYGKAAYHLVRAARQVSGLRLPLLIVSRSKLSSVKGIRPEVRAALARNLSQGSKGDAAFLAAGDYGVIVLPDVGHFTEVITKLAHEVGHAFMETHFRRAQDKDVQYLKRVFKRDRSGEFDDAAFAEWAADQWAHWAVGQGNLLNRRMSQPDSLFARLLQMMYRVWETARGLLDNATASYPFSAYMAKVADKAARGTVAVSHLRQDTVHNFRVKPKQVARGIAAKAKSAWRNPFQAAYRMVYTQLNDISPRLTELLYQPSVTANSGTGQAWQSLTNYLSDRWQGRIGQALRGYSEAQIKRGWAALRRGDMTPMAKKLRRLIDGINRDIGERAVYHTRPDFIPEAFSHEALAERRSEFDALLAEHFSDMSDDRRRVLVDSILYADGVTDFTVAPGKPVSQHANVDALLSNRVFAQAAADAGFLLDNPMAVLHHFAQSAAKRTAWEQKFGGYISLKEGTSAAVVRNSMLEAAHVDLDKLNTDEKRRAAAERLGLERDGQFYSPNAHFQAEIDAIRREKGAEAAQRAIQLVRNAMGLDGSSIPDAIRNAQNWVMTFLNYTMLAFSGVVSIPEIAGGNIRGAGRVGLRDTLQVLREFRSEHSRAVDLGVVMSDMAEKAVLESMGPEYHSPKQHKLNYWLFKLNGQQAVMRTARTMALGLGRRYILRTMQAAQRGDKRALAELKELNLTLEQVQRWQLNGQKGVVAVDEALSQFVYEAVVQPSRFEATTWGNNPWMKLAWHLKQFFYSYANRVLLGIWRARGGRYSAARDEGYGAIRAGAYAVVPGMIAASLLVPMAMGAQELREWIQGSDRTEKMDGFTYSVLVYDKLGAFGPFSILANMKQASDWGRSPLMALTTSTSRLEQLFDLGEDGRLSDRELESKLRLLVPFFSQNAVAWDKARDAF